jgi:hypothetical protein
MPDERAVGQYAPQAYSGLVAIIRSRGCCSEISTPTYGWRDFIRDRLEIYQLPMYPEEMLIEPFCYVTLS